MAFRTNRSRWILTAVDDLLLNGSRPAMLHDPVMPVKNDSTGDLQTRLHRHFFTNIYPLCNTARNRVSVMTARHGYE
jgi:hypothetical protein